MSQRRLTPRAPVNPEVLRWARARTGLSYEELESQFPKIREWESGVLQPTIRQVSNLAIRLRIGEGYLWLSDIPYRLDSPAIPDHRSHGRKRKARSTELVPLIYLCQRRQNWYETYALSEGLEPPGFRDSFTLQDAPSYAAASLCAILRFEMQQRGNYQSWEDAFGSLVNNIESNGILVMLSNTLLDKTQRKLDSEEFRGLCVLGDYSPVIFVNTDATKDAQFYTLIHSLAHVLLGCSAISDAKMHLEPDWNDTEIWCHEVALEFFMPENETSSAVYSLFPNDDPITELSVLFKVPKLVVAECLRKLGHIADNEYYATLQSETEVSEIASRKRDRICWEEKVLRQASRKLAVPLLYSGSLARTNIRDVLRMLSLRRPRDFHRLYAYIKK